MKVAFELIPKEFISDTAFYDYSDPMSDALSKVNKFGAVVVFKDGEYYGVVDNRSIAQKGITKMPENYPVGKFAKQVPIVSTDNDIKHAIQVFYDSSSKAAPLSQNNKITGILKRTDILKSILSLHILASYTAGDIMSTPLVAIDQEANIERAKDAMREHGVNRLVVIDKGKLVGVLPYRNIIESNMQMQGRSPEFSEKGRKHVKVGAFVDKNTNTMDQDDSVEQAIRDMIKNNVSSVLVTRKGRPAGMLTIRDILETVVKNSNVPRRNIVLSGLNERTREYEEDIKTALESFAEKVDRFRDVKVGYIAVNVKEIKGTKSRQYELKARLGLEHGGTVSMSALGFNLERTLKVLTAKLYKTIETKNDIVITKKTSKGTRADEEE